MEVLVLVMVLEWMGGPGTDSMVDTDGCSSSWMQIPTEKQEKLVVSFYNCVCLTE
jgi:hypothetical protein